MPPSIAERLRDLRYAARLSTYELGALAGVSAAAISRIERGQTPSPSFRILDKLATALGFDGVDALLRSDRRDPSSGPVSNVVGRIDQLRPPEARCLPIYRWGSAGDPRSHETAPDPVALDYPPVGSERFLGDGAFGVQIRGESVSNWGIHDGDVVWCNPHKSPRPGDIVVARVQSEFGDDLGLVVKLLKHDGTDQLWGDGDGEDGHNPVLCGSFTIFGPVVAVQPLWHVPRRSH